MPYMYDVAIIGAGPAGATLARLIGDQYNVLLIEKRRLPDESEGFSAIKCCGGAAGSGCTDDAVQTGFGPAKERFRGPSTFCC